MAALDRMALVCAGVTLSTSIACAGSETPSFSSATDETSTSSSSATTVGTEDAACACILPPYNGGGLMPPACGPRLCEVHAICPTLANFTCLDRSDTTLDEAGLSCALEALAARTPGYIEWSVTFSSEENTSESGYVVLLDDGAAITQSVRFADFLKEYRGAMLGPMPGQDYFDACSASTSPAERFECLAFVPDEPQVVCDAPW